MEIKRIQLRGISRSPSDRMTDDGGIAESLNLYLDNTENAPVVMPKDVTTDLGLPSEHVWEKVYLHKTLTSENYIVLTQANDSTERMMLAIWKDNQYAPLIFLNEGENAGEITSLGNTLVVSTSSRMLYFLYSKDNYEFIGDAIPKLSLSFVNYSNNRGYTGTEAPFLAADYTVDDGNPIVWGKEEYNYELQDDFSLGVLQEIYNLYKGLIGKNLRLGYINGPILLRYAIRLYDGTYLDASSPILLGGAYDTRGKLYKDPLYITYKREAIDSDGRQSTYNFSIRLRDSFRIGVYKNVVNPDKLAKWKDIIDSVDVYVSPLVDLYPNGNTRAKQEDIEDASGTGYNKRLHLDPMISLDEEQIEQQIVSAAPFYKIKSYNINDFIKDNGEMDVLREDLTGENLWTESNILKDSDIGSTFLAEHLTTFNNSIIASGSKIILPSGLHCLNGQHAYNSDEIAYYAFRYHISSPTSGDLVVYSENYQNPSISPIINPSKGSYLKQSGQVLTRVQSECDSFALVTFPDSRCTSVDIFKYTSAMQFEGMHTLAMKPHPFVPNCSYAWIGLGQSLSSLDYVNENQEITDVPENLVDMSANKLMVSEVNNPFVFPLSRMHSFQSRIEKTAIATNALSQGQFGQFPLYIFTEDGIWVMETGADGSFTTSKPLSREVCVNPGSITPIDNSVVFVTEKGLMMLQGSTIVNLSPYMNGRHYTIEETAKTIISAQYGFSQYIDVLSDNTPFMAFMKKASIAYDYAGQRLICIAIDEKYQYVYKLDTQTWHKLAHDMQLEMPINSYPRCLVLSKENDYSRVYDFSTLLDVSEQLPTIRGVIATRPFDLSEPDVFKTIKDVRIRGQFPKGAVKFILLGSLDGINFRVINTLRGKSWKLFRLIILADLDPTDRISWVDIGYETRFTNKLR